MRLRSLNLIRYGQFTGKTLAFRPDARLHLVVGGNEAGKSTALAAIGDLLFGFPKSPAYDFQHDMRTLRVGAEIAARDGRLLSFERTKGLKTTLRAPDDTALADDALAPFLGTISREVFEQAFGLSSRALRAGAEAMIDQHGELGAALLGAASGLGDLTKLSDRLEEEAGRIFGRKASERLFWKAAESYQTARKEMLASELTAPKWKRLNEEIAVLSGRGEDVRRRLRVVEERMHRLDRLANVGPIIAQINERLSAIAALGEVPNVRPDYLGDLGMALTRRDKAVEAVETAGNALLKAREELSSVTIDRALLASGATIDALVRDIRAEEAARHELSQAEDQERRTRGRLADLVASLPDGIVTDGGDASDSDAEAPSSPVGPLAPLLALIRELAAGGRGRETDLRRLEDRLREEDDRLAELVAAREKAGLLTDPAPLRADLAEFDADLAAADGLPRLLSDIAEEARQLSEEAGRMSPPCPALDRLAHASRPTAETITRYRDDFERLTRERERAEDAATKARADTSALSTDLDRLRADGEVATPEALAEARSARDLAWTAMRQVLLGQAEASPIEVGAGIASFEIAVARADALADTAIRDAGRVREYGLKDRQRAEAEAEVKHQADIIASVAAELATRRDIWTDEWRDLGLIPLPPAEMLTWLHKAEILLSRREQVEARRAHARLIAARSERLAAPLAALAERVGLALLDGAEPPVVAARIRARIEELAESWTSARSLSEQIEQKRIEFERLQRARVRLIEEADSWQPRWAAAMPLVGLNRDATLAEAEAVIAVYEQLPEARRAHDEAARRLATLDQSIARFAEAAGRLVAALAPDLADVAPSEAVSALAKRLTAARDARTRHDHLAGQQSDAEIGLETASSVLSEAEERLARLAAEAGFGDAALLADLYARLSRRAQLTGQLGNERRLLGEGESEDSLRTSLAGLDPDSAQAERDDLARERERLIAEDRDIYADLSARERERETQERGSGAEAAAQRRAAAEADMAGLARDWVVIKLAAAFLAKASARHRAGRHVPLMERAGTLFSHLTGGSFAGLDQDEGEDGEVLLVGRRPSGDKVPIGRVRGSGRKGPSEREATGLSEGTLDQLYLAMRLAYLEDFARSAEPAPFIGDDLFVTFDDRRTGLGLEALAATSELIQPIVFTHHSRVAEIARERLGQHVDIVEI
ncbi:MAG: AAA family ATPase [Ancalomicrobiaceae bacterium]|nr:AAA family ATPase [Ancalomicrobiaceae bacterium]